MVLGIVGGVALALPALAAANCVTTNDSTRVASTTQFAEGYYRDDSNQFTIVKANILVRNPDLAPNCNTYFCWSWAWVMMTTNSSSSGGWAQIGPDHGNVATFGNEPAGTDVDQCAIYSNGQVTDVYTNWFQVSSVGSAPLYAVQNGTDPLGHANNKLFYINGSLYDFCGTSAPFVFPRTEAEAAGEITDAQTQLPGGTSGVEQWTNGRLADGSSGFDWFSGGSVFFNNSRSWMGGPNIPSSSTMDTWDKDCP